MPARVTGCSFRPQVDALIADELDAADKSAVQRHLGQCDACRTHFRLHTSECFPRFRSYTILEEIGKGGFGVVYKAVHHAKERIEALKVLFGTTALREAYFENEVHVIAQLRHPNIATLYEAHLQSAPHYYTMEFVEGESLDKYCRTHAMSLEDRIRIVKTVADAVEYAHQNGVIHRDLKPQNILIDADGQARILDFGIAKRHVEDEAAAERAAKRPHEGAMGTYGYMPPEQLAGEDVDARADVYSLGALLFHVITGQAARFAVHADRLRDLLRKHHVNRADDLAAIIDCCVQELPEDRYASCAALVEDLGNYLEARPVNARRDTTPGYRAARIAALVVRNYPGAVQAAAAALAVCLLTWVLATADARLQVAGPLANRVALVAVKPSTVGAITRGDFAATLPELTAQNPKSWRLLYGRFMERLAEGAPRAVVWDYYFPDAQPDYDAAFVQGITALDAPVVVGCARFDENGEPQIAPSIRAVTQGWGLLIVKDPAFLREEMFMPLGVQRGHNPAVPSLSVAGYAAARYPDCDLALRPRGQEIELAYRRQEVPAGQLRWPDTDVLPVFEVETVGSRHNLTGAPDALQEDDRIYLGRFSLHGIERWPAQAVALEDVLQADAAQLRSWFENRVVLIGEMCLRDRHTLRSGLTIHGCQTHAQVIQALLSQTTIAPVFRPLLALRVIAWCVLAMVIVNLVPIGHVLASRWGAMLGTAMILAGAVGGGALAIHFTQVWQVETLIAACALATGAGAALLVRRRHVHELRLTPGVEWSVGDTTVSTTMLATTRASTSAGA